MKIARKLVSTALALVGAVSGAHAQCQPEWQAAPSYYTANENINGIIYASTVWDPDGAGPLNPMLVIGGSFTSIGGVSGYNRIAAWDGTTWRALSTGCNNYVLALTVDTNTNTLIVGGQFTTAGLATASKIARFNYQTQAFSAIGSGIPDNGVLGNGVYALAFSAEYNEIYMGGIFSTAGGIITGGIARYNGSYHICGGTLPSSGYVYGLMYDAPGRNLYVACRYTGGSSPNIGRYNAANQTWYDMSTGLPGFGAFTSIMYQGQPVVGGSFDSSTGAPGNFVARWTGSAWAPMSSGLGGIVRAFAEYYGVLYAFGDFTTTGSGAAASHVAWWDGSAWRGLSGLTIGGETQTTINGAVVYKGLLHITGNFSMIDGVARPKVATLDAVAHWDSPRSAPSGPVRSILNMGTSIVIGGAFDMRDAGGVSAHNIVGRSDSGYGAFQNLTGFNGTNGPVNSLLFRSNGVTVGSTYVGGSFSAAGGTSASNLASTSVSEWNAVGSGTDGEIKAIATYQCTGSPLNQVCGVVMTGTFGHSGATAASNIARFGPGSVSINMGTGLNGPGNALAVYNGELYVGGSFTSAGGLPSGAFARWNGTSWNICGGSFGGTVYALCVYDNYLAVGGSYGGIGSPNIAVWNSTLGGYWTLGQGFNGAVRALAMHKGDLYAGGDFTMAGNVVVNHIAHYNRTTLQWEAVGSGTDGRVLALASSQGVLWVGGEFLYAGTTYSPYLAQYKCTCYVNCDNSTATPALNVNDFQCFMNQYAAGLALPVSQQAAAYANCDGSVSAPVLNTNDFQCFINKFAIGCP